jgi:hypothetical protein
MPLNDLFGEGFENEQILEEEKPKKIVETPSTEILYNILRIVLSLDEQLFAMI